MNQPFDVIDIKLPPKAEYVAVARLTISGIASRMGFSYEEIEDIKIAVSEALTNAVQHAYKGNAYGVVMLRVNIYKSKLEIVVSDHGESFDPNNAKNKSLPYNNEEKVELMREGGLGLFLIETLMDEVKIHQKNGVVVFMTKFLEREQVERDAETISTS